MIQGLEEQTHTVTVMGPNPEVHVSHAQIIISYVSNNNYRKLQLLS